MIETIQGNLTADQKKFALVAGRFNEFISSKLIEGAVDCLMRHKASEKDISLAWVPGSFEIPVVARKLAQSGKYDAVICLGAVIRGATPHFDYVASEVAKGIAQSSLELGVPIIFGIITSDTIEQAIERAGTKAGNRGWDAALAAIEMVDLIQQL